MWDKATVLDGMPLFGKGEIDDREVIIFQVP
jgi:hypothetical protein